MHNNLKNLTTYRTLCIISRKNEGVLLKIAERLFR